MAERSIMMFILVASILVAVAVGRYRAQRLPHSAQTTITMIGDNSYRR